MTARSPWVITTDDNDSPLHDFKIKVEARRDRARAVVQGLSRPDVLKKFPWVQVPGVHRYSDLELMSLAFKLSDTVLDWADNNLSNNQ